MKFLQNVYIHVPFCVKKCHYCNFAVHSVGCSPENKHHFQDLENRYVDYLLREIEQTIHPGLRLAPLRTLYLGGGTPSLLSLDCMARIVEQVMRHFPGTASDFEFTVECDPGTFDRHYLQGLADLRVNRLSLGIQSFDARVLKQLNRYGHHPLEAIAVVKSVKQFQTLSNVSLDFLFNLPFPQELHRDCEEILRLRPGHLSLYSLQIEKGSYFHDKLNYRENAHPLPTNDSAKHNYLAIHEKLTRAGYEHYEVSNFALASEFRSKHNEMYWKGDLDFLGFGMGASSLLAGKRTTRPKSLKKYFGFVDGNVQAEEEDEQEEWDNFKVLLISGLRTKDGIAMDRFNQKQQQTIRKYLDKGNVQQYLHIEDGHLRVRVP